MEDAPNPAPQDPQPDAWRAKLISMLSLTPAEGETEVSDAAIDEALGNLTTTGARAAELETAAGTAAEQLAAANAELERVRTDYQALYDREEVARKARDEAEVATILEEYAERIATPEAKARIQALLMSDRESALDILKGLPAAAGAPGKSDEPPAPQHDPAKQGATNGATDEQIAAAIAAEAKRLQAATPNMAYAAAWEKADKAVRAKVAAGQPL